MVRVVLAFRPASPAPLMICHPDRGLQSDRGICGSSRGAAARVATHSLQASVQAAYFLLESASQAGEKLGSQSGQPPLSSQH